MVLKSISSIIPKRVKRAWLVLNQPNAMIEKQFSFVWRDSTTATVQWHLIDYETYAKEGYSMNALANIAIGYKMDSFALAPLRAYKGKKDSPIPLPEDNPLAMLCSRPNNYQSWFEFISLCVAYYNIDGNAFIYKKPNLTNSNSNIPEGLYPLRPDKVFIKPLNKAKRGDVMYLYVPEGETYATGIPILPQDMMHIKTVNPYDPLEGMGYGLPPLMPASKDVDMDNMFTKFLFNVISHQGIMPGGFIELPMEVDPDDMALLRQQFMDSEGGYENWGRPIVLDEGATFRPNAFTLDQLNIEALDKRQIKRVMGVFGVPAKLIGLDDDSSTFSNVAEAREEFWNRTMRAELRAFEDEFTYRLREENKDWFVKFDLSDVPAFQTDLLESSQIFMNLVQNGVPINIAAQRANLEIPLIEGGDKPLISSSLVPLEDAGKQPENNNPFGNTPTQDTPSEDNPDSGGDSGTQNVPTDDEDMQSDSAKNKAYGFHRWDFEQKKSMSKSMDNSIRKFEAKFARAATRAFENDRKAIMDIIENSKAIISWRVARQGINLYLSTTGNTQWRQTFAPVIVELTKEQTQLWMDRAPDIFPSGTFSLRNVEAEAWFNNYTLQFASAVTEGTRNDIHRIIADGLEHGLSNDEIARVLDKLFTQYIEGNVSPDDFAFLNERMPIHRRELIARTETHGAMSAGNNALYMSAGIQKREWLATGDDRTRDTHAEAGQRYSEDGLPGPITFQQSFMVGGHAMRYPGDRNAPIQEWANCRCTELPFIE